MKKIVKVLAVSLLAVVLVGCGAGRTREEKVSAMLNKIDEPFFVVSTDLQNLMDKSAVMEEGTIPFTYFQVLTFFLAVELTGIDYSTDVQVVVGEGESFVPNFYGIFKIENEELFTELLEVEANAEVIEKEGMHYVIKDSEQYCIVWDSEFAIASSIPMDFASMLSGNSGKKGLEMIDKNIEVIKAAKDGEVDADWVTFLSKESDISMRYDGAGFYNYMSIMAMGEEEDLEKMKDLYEGMNYDVFIDFNNGSIDIEMVADLSDDLKEKLSFISTNGVDADLLKYGKSKNPLLTGTYNVEIDGVLDYVKDMSEESYGEMEENVSEIGLSIEDLKTAFTGQLVYMVDGIVESEEIIDFGYGDPIVVPRTEPNFAFVLGVSDMGYIESAFGGLMVPENFEADVQEDMPKITLLDNGVIQMGDALVYLGKDVIFVSNDMDWVNMIASGSGVKINNPEGVLSSNPFTLYADITRLVGLESLKDGSDYIDLLESVSMSVNMDGGKITFNLTDKNENSLKTLTQTIGAAMSEFEKMSNPEMDAELQDAVDETENAFDKLDEIDVDEIEDAVNDAFDDLNQ